MTVAATVAGVCAVRDARDLIGLVCGHYLRVGFAHLSFIDDGSSDGTFELLSALAEKEPRVSVRKVISPSFLQAELMCDAANELIGRGFSVIVPFDADEFWNVTALQLETCYADAAEICFRGKWLNYVQDRDAFFPKMLGLFRIGYTAPSMPDVGMETVTAFTRPFVGHLETKVGFKAGQAVRFEKGQHSLLVGPQTVDSREYEIFHVPLRSKNEIAKRGLNYEPRIAISRANPTRSWQSYFHSQVVLTERTDEVWAANSADRNGYLDCYGERVRLNRDTRLRRLLLRSWAFLARRYGMILPG